MGQPWIRSRHPSGSILLYYDGDCGLCHRWVRFVLKRDRRPVPIRFAPQQGGSFARLRAERPGEDLPDSVVVITADGDLRVRSRAILYLLGALGGWWRVSGALARLVPAVLADVAYDRIAAARKRWFAAPDTVCPVVSAELRERFDLE